MQHAHQESTLPSRIKDLYDKGQLFEQLDVEIKPQVSLQPMIDLAQLGSQALSAKLWFFALPATDMFFVTADNPVSFQLPEQFRGPGAPHIGPFHPLSEVTAPLRKDLVLICSPSVGYRAHEVRHLHFRTVKFNRADTKNINERTAIADEDMSMRQRNRQLWPVWLGG